jgi:ubiquinone/menaquinone biosynthesis C-methylase UbiE
MTVTHGFTDVDMTSPTRILTRGLAVFKKHKPRILLDLGCGVGSETPILAEALGTRIVAVDHDAAALAAASPNPNVFYVRADATRLPFGESTIDACYSFGLLQELGQNGDAPLRLLTRELDRVLEKSGVAILGTIADFRNTNSAYRNLTGAEVSKVLRGHMVLQELIGLMDIDINGQQTRYWYISATPTKDAE